MDANALKSLGSSVAATAATGGISTGFGAANGLFSGLLNRWNMKKQYQYNLEQWQREVARQDYLLENQMVLQKEAMKKAGYSTADPTGAGTTLSAAAPSANGTSALPASFSPVQSVSPEQMANVNLLNAEAQKAMSEKKLIDKNAGVFDEQYVANLGLTNAKAFQADAEGRYTEFLKNAGEQKLPHELTFLGLQNQKVENEIAEILVRMDTLRSQKNLNEEQQRTLQEQQRLYRAKTSEAFANAAQSLAVAENQKMDSSIKSFYLENIAPIEQQIKHFEGLTSEDQYYANNALRTVNIDGQDVTYTGWQLDVLQKANNLALAWKNFRLNERGISAQEKNAGTAEVNSAINAFKTVLGLGIAAFGLTHGNAPVVVGGFATAASGSLN